MSGEVRDSNKIEMQALIKFCSARQGDEGNSGHSDRNIRGTCTIVCYRQNWVAQVKHSSTFDAPRPGGP
jgi:hypothetical protein